ncbi:hypothetical protein SEA_CASSITA_18 [Microbacterium phage Cassita]|nr:hypothetical protein SEA_CASSITA_18 [Microbacterium phage Cassita]
MANIPPLEIKIDQDAIRDQVKSGIEEALREASIKFRMAADALDPSFRDAQEKWIEDAINSKVEARMRLKAAEK